MRDAACSGHEEEPQPERSSEEKLVRRRQSFQKIVDAQSSGSSKRSLTARFFDLSQEDIDVSSATSFRLLQLYLKNILHHPKLALAMGFIVIFDVAIGGVEIDARASGFQTPWLVEACSVACLIVFSIEVLAHTIVDWPCCGRSGAYVFDTLITLASAAAYVFQEKSPGPTQLGAVHILRCFRILRLLCFLRKLAMFKRPRLLMRMIISSAKTLIWSFVICFTLLVIWSMAAVELINPVVQQMVAEGYWEGCDTCAGSMSAIPRSFLTFYKLAMTGEDFGTFAEPIIVKHPWTAIFFIGSSLTIVFGVLHLVVAVVVDEFAESRSNDFMTRAHEMDEELSNDRKRLRAIFNMIDADGSGEVTLDELQSAARRVPQFRHLLRWMDIDEADIEQLFILLDDDASGEIEYSEFVSVLSRWMRDSKTASRFMKHNLVKVQDQQESMRKMVASLFLRFDDKFNNLSDNLSSMHAPPSCGTVSANFADGNSKTHDAVSMDSHMTEALLGLDIHVENVRLLDQALQHAKMVVAHTQASCTSEVSAHKRTALSALHKNLAGDFSDAETFRVPSAPGPFLVNAHSAESALQLEGSGSESLEQRTKADDALLFADAYVNDEHPSQFQGECG